MCNAVLLSKRLKGNLDSIVEDTGSLRQVSGRCSGDTTGLVHTIIGNLMLKTESYEITERDLHLLNKYSGVDTQLEAQRILKECRHLIAKMDYEYFVCTKTSIKYEPWL